MLGIFCKYCTPPPTVFHHFVTGGEYLIGLMLSTMYHGLPEYSCQPYCIKVGLEDGTQLCLERDQISYDGKHDSHLSFANDNNMLDWLDEYLWKEHSTKLEFVAKITDNCGKEYKCAEAFVYNSKISANRKIYVVPIQREKLHGKGKHDAAGGIVKRAVDDSVRAGIDMRDQAVLIEYLNKHFSKPRYRGKKTAKIKLRSFGYTESVDHCLSRYPTLPKTKSYNCYMTTPELGEKKIYHRSLPCLRSCCRDRKNWINGVPQNCVFKRYTGEWRVFDFTTKKGKVVDGHG